jgi:hypothetical protein
VPEATDATGDNGGDKEPRVGCQTSVSFGATDAKSKMLTIIWTEQDRNSWRRITSYLIDSNAFQPKDRVETRRQLTAGGRGRRDSFVVLIVEPGDETAGELVSGAEGQEGNWKHFTRLICTLAVS